MTAGSRKGRVRMSSVLFHRLEAPPERIGVSLALRSVALCDARGRKSRFAWRKKCVCSNYINRDAAASSRVATRVYVPINGT